MDNNDQTMFSRGASRSHENALQRGHEKLELRVDITRELAGRIDMMLMIENLQARGDWVIPVLERAIEKEIHRATVVLRCAGINPLASDGSGNQSGGKP